jgi:hypothetical protein
MGHFFEHAHAMINGAADRSAAAKKLALTLFNGACKGFGARLIADNHPTNRLALQERASPLEHLHGNGAAHA